MKQQVWVNIWRKRDASPYDSDPYRSSAFPSYDDAMEDLYETGERFSVPALRYNMKTRKTESVREYYDYVCTQYSRLDESGKILEHETYTDLPDEVQQWHYEREEDAKAYAAARRHPDGYF